MELDTDKRFQGNFKNDIEWGSLGTLHYEAMDSVKKGIQLTDDLIQDKSNEIVQSGIDVDSLKGIVLSFKDIRNEIEKTSLLHKNKSGKVDTENYDAYTEYLEIASKYQSLMENTATLISSGYMDVLNTAIMKSEFVTEKESAQEALTGLKEVVNNENESEIKNIEDKLDGK